MLENLVTLLYLHTDSSVSVYIRGTSRPKMFCWELLVVKEITRNLFHRPDMQHVAILFICKVEISTVRKKINTKDTY